MRALLYSFLPLRMQFKVHCLHHRHHQLHCRTYSNKTIFLISTVTRWIEALWFRSRISAFATTRSLTKARLPSHLFFQRDLRAFLKSPPLLVYKTLPLLRSDMTKNQREGMLQAMLFFSTRTLTQHNLNLNLTHQPWCLFAYTASIWAGTTSRGQVSRPWRKLLKRVLSCNTYLYTPLEESRRSELDPSRR